MDGREEAKDDREEDGREEDEDDRDEDDREEDADDREGDKNEVVKDDREKDSHFQMIIFNCINFIVGRGELGEQKGPNVRNGTIDIQRAVV